MYELMVNAAAETDPVGPPAVELVWHQLALNLDEQPVDWSAADPLRFS